MLSSLHIENMAVIRSMNADFDAGFTVITGETGAGKSVMMESLYLLAGGKAERDIIRHGEERATVSALFTDLSEATLRVLSAYDIFPDEDGCLTLVRTITTEGKSVAKINGKTVSLSVMREVFPHLLHIHAQEDNSFLRHAGSELAVLDTAAHNQKEKDAYIDIYRKLLSVKSEMEKLRLDESEKLRTMESLSYQIAEIEEVSPKEGEEEALFDEKMRLRHIEKITKQASFAYRALRGAEKGNACYIIDRAEAALRTLGDVLPEAVVIADSLEEHLSAIEDLAARIEDLTDLRGASPTEALDAVESRLAAISRLNRKYGGSLSRVLQFEREAKEKLSMLESSGELLLALEQECEQLTKEAEAAALVLHETRERVARLLEKEIAENLRDLDMPKAEFSVSLAAKRRKNDAQRYELNENGFDDVTFLAAVNVGEPYIPIAKAASGGEMSRIMLAIKTVIARHDGLPTVIFDEVDSGVSGKTSRKIGFSLLRSAKTAQVLSITHSAQIASLAHRHLLVYKEEKDGRTQSSVRLLSEEERVAELARILGGIAVTDAQRQAARDMLKGENL